MTLRERSQFLKKPLLFFFETCGLVVIRSARNGH